MFCSRAGCAPCWAGGTFGRVGRLVLLLGVCLGGRSKSAAAALPARSTLWASSTRPKAPHTCTLHTGCTYRPLRSPYSPWAGCLRDRDVEDGRSRGFPDRMEGINRPKRGAEVGAELLWLLLKAEDQLLTCSLSLRASASTPTLLHGLDNWSTTNFPAQFPLPNRLGITGVVLNAKNAKQPLPPTWDLLQDAQRLTGKQQVQRAHFQSTENRVKRIRKNVPGLFTAGNFHFHAL